MIRTGGTLVLVGVTRQDAMLALPITAFIMTEKRVIGTLMGSTPFQTFLPKLAAHYLNGNLLLDELVSQQIPLEAINEGYEQMAQGKVARSVVTF